MNRTATMLIAAAALAASPALADPVSIGGNATTSASTRSSTAVSAGWGTRATNSTGSIHASRIGGNAAASGSAGSQTSIALGTGSRARTYVGSIRGANTGGSASARATARSVTAIALRPGTDVCAAIGSVGRGGSRAAAAVGSVVAYDFGLWRRTRVRVGNSGSVC
ncbi:MAG: hypothetical protein RIQ46_150 [Pseudomonadota bacterium]